MDNRKLYIAIGILIISVGLGSCNNADNGSAVSVFSNAVQQIEIPEPEPDIVEQDDPVEENENVEEDIVDDTPLTQEEIDELKANATTDMAREGIEAYESIINTGSWAVPGQGGQSIVTEVVGKPGDTSWRRMTDEEAREYQEKYPYSYIGDGELEAGSWNALYYNKIYFNPYECEKAMKEDLQKDIDSGKVWDFENKAQVKLKDGRVISYKEADEQGLLDDADYIFQD